MITEKMLRELAPNSAFDYELLAKGLKHAFHKYDINTPRRVAYFLAQILHETGGLQWDHELGDEDYFKKYEPSTKVGKRLGNTEKGDGYRYRGRGLIQLTGRYNYRVFGEKLQLPLEECPELAACPRIAPLIAARYWADRNLNVYASRDDFSTVTKRINGGLNGYESRLEWLAKVEKLIE